MTAEKAKKTGSRQALLVVGVGLLMAQLIMMVSVFSYGGSPVFFWFIAVDYKVNLLIGIMVLFLCGHIFGQRAGLEILIQKRNCTWVGMKYGLLTLIATAFLAGWTGFFQEGFDNAETLAGSIYDYVVKPAYWLLLFGFIPAIFLGFWLGRQIDKRGKNVSANL